MVSDYNVGFIGAGNMGGAIIKGLLSSGVKKAGDLVLSDPRTDALKRFAIDFPGIHTTEDNTKAACADILILAVKPNVYERVIRGIRDSISPDTVVVTIAAGLKLATVADWFNKHGKIVRTMPNTPALVSEGMTALCPADKVGENELAEVRSLFDAVGRTVVIPEKMMDAYTALAGSSPALVFMFLEALADGAVLEGIPRAMAYEIAAQAVLGSAKLLQNTQKHPGELKDQVCSPGGTTIEAVATLEAAGFRGSIIEAVKRCRAKAEELGK